eukprot:8830751-Pyramimonas_sp.AAC.1
MAQVWRCLSCLFLGGEGSHGAMINAIGSATGATHPCSTARASIPRVVHQPADQHTRNDVH